MIVKYTALSLKVLSLLFIVGCSGNKTAFTAAGEDLLNSSDTKRAPASAGEGVIEVRPTVLPRPVSSTSVVVPSRPVATQPTASPTAVVSATSAAVPTRPVVVQPTASTTAVVSASSVVVHRDCTLSGKVIKHGTTELFYQSALVPTGQSCVSQPRSCINGALAGSYTQATCAVQAVVVVKQQREVLLNFHCSTSQSGSSRNLLSMKGPFKYGTKYGTLANGALSTTTCYEDGTLTIEQIKSKKIIMKKCPGPIFFEDVEGYVLYGSGENKILYDVNIVGVSQNNIQTQNQLEIYQRANNISELDQEISRTGIDYEKRGLAPPPSKMSTTIKNQLLCDTAMSPLFIDLSGEEEKKFTLSAPWNGVWFDIMGRNADPAPYSPMKISWFKDEQIGFITLPNRKGQVLGIDQLFGDNTFGPDKNFAANGFHALAKHDTNADHIIDEDDVVYEQLRLWVDRNQDGKSDTSELSTLREHEIEAIDLKYDADYLERDKYGNEIKYKSVALRKSYNPGDKQKFFMVFDVWFETSHFKAKQRVQNYLSGQ